MAGKKRIGDINLLIAKRELKKQFEQLFIDMQKFSQSIGFKEAVQKFNYCLRPLPDGIQRLPVYNNKPTSKRKSKDFCVLYCISWAVQLYWRLQKDKLRSDELIKHYMSLAKEYLEDGRDAYDVAGDKFGGFYLRKK